MRCEMRCETATICVYLDDILITGRSQQEQLKQVFRVKKTRGAPIGRPKLELLASNGVARDFCHAI